MAKRRSATKAERQYMDRVARLGCIVCRNEFGVYTEAGIHHIRSGQGGAQRASNYEVLPLCGAHHQTGGHGVAIHAGQQTWESLYGTELELLAQVQRLIGEAA